MFVFGLPGTNMYPKMYQDTRPSVPVQDLVLWFRVLPNVFLPIALCCWRSKLKANGHACLYLRWCWRWQRWVSGPACRLKAGTALARSCVWGCGCVGIGGNNTARRPRGPLAVSRKELLTSEICHGSDLACV